MDLRMQYIKYYQALRQNKNRQEISRRRSRRLHYSDGHLDSTNFPIGSPNLSDYPVGSPHLSDYPVGSPHLSDYPGSPLLSTSNGYQWVEQGARFYDYGFVGSDCFYTNSNSDVRVRYSGSDSMSNDPTEFNYYLEESLALQDDCFDNENQVVCFLNGSMWQWKSLSQDDSFDNENQVACYIIYGRWLLPLPCNTGSIL